MTLAFLAIAFSLVILIWSAFRFVEGSSVIARKLGVPPLLIGIVVVGFGTSSPEMAVAVLASLDDNPNLALGSAYGSNIASIALVLGLAALFGSVYIHSQALRKELPILIAVTAMATWQLWDGKITRVEALLLLGVFAGLMGWAIWEALQKKADALGSEMQHEMQSHAVSTRQAFFRLISGMGLLVASSYVLVWGAVEIAHNLGVSDLIVGLTIVAVGTSLPELMASFVAARKGEHDIAVGNVLGSNLFNTLAVVGIAGAIHPITVEPEVLTRDMAVMASLTVLLYVVGFGFRRPGRINQYEGLFLLFCYFAYISYLVNTAGG